MTVIVNYQKRKNLELFKTLEKEEFTHLSNVQNYVPIYKRFFDLNSTNYNSINLNHKWFLSNIRSKIDGIPNTYQCTLKNSTTNKTKPKNVFMKMAPLMDPFKYLVGKYNTQKTSLYDLPQFDMINGNKVDDKMLDMNNSAYIDSMFFYLSSQLIYSNNFIHGVDFYGSFLAIKNKLSLNIYDDLDYLHESEYFNKNKNLLFHVDEYEYLFPEKDNYAKLKPIRINNNCSARSCLSVYSIKDEIFEDLFVSPNTITLDDLKDRSIELVDISNSDVFFKRGDEKITSLHSSGSTCSSRTSHTEDGNNECQGEEGEYGEDEEDEEDEEDDEEEDGEEDGEEESIEAIIPKFPVQMICLEKCENTFDSLIMENNLKEEEFFSAFMQIIMILITYQKVFSFTHNDLHSNNIMYNKTDKKYIYYCYNKKYYKVPTFGRLFKIIDFGRSIYKFQGKVFCSDSFNRGGDAVTQYNIEPYFNDKKPRLEPNYSFDLCRLACSLFDYFIDDLKYINKPELLDPVTNIIVDWCKDDNGTNLLYKSDGNERYPEFKLYKMIARHVHNHTPHVQLERKEFKKFLFLKKDVPANENVINIDDLATLS